MRGLCFCNMLDDFLKQAKTSRNMLKKAKSRILELCGLDNMQENVPFIATKQVMKRCINILHPRQWDQYLPFKQTEAQLIPLLPSHVLIYSTSGPDHSVTVCLMSLSSKAHKHDQPLMLVINKACMSATGRMKEKVGVINCPLAVCLICKMK